MNPHNIRDRQFVITIGRQFGCRARDIGKAIAEKLGYKYYDKTLLSEVSEQLGLSEHIFTATDEKRPTWVRSLLSFNYGALTSSGEYSSLDGEGLYKAQSEIIKRIADRESCVIVGRTADYILRDHPGLISIFLHAPLDTRCRNIIDRGDAQEPTKALELAKRFDKDRESYYKYFTNRRWGSAETYHISLNTDLFTIEEIVDIISAKVANLKENK